MPRIYVASLSDYNNGDLHGEWIDLEGLTVDEVNERVQDMFKRGPAAGRLENPEEWAIHDYEGFGPVHVDEWESFDRLVALAKGLDQHGDAFGEFVFWFSLEPDEALAQFEDAYIGEMSAGEYAEQLVDDCYLPELTGTSRDFFSQYFDYAKFAHDMVIGGDINEHNGHLFHGNW